VAVSFCIVKIPTHSSVVDVFGDNGLSGVMSHSTIGAFRSRVSFLAYPHSSNVRAMLGVEIYTHSSVVDVLGDNMSHSSACTCAVRSRIFFSRLSAHMWNVVGDTGLSRGCMFDEDISEDSSVL